MKRGEMRPCAECDCYRAVSERGGNCRLEPPKIFVIPIEQATKIAPNGKTLVPGSVTMAPASYFPSVRVIDSCSSWRPIVKLAGEAPREFRVQ